MKAAVELGKTYMEKGHGGPFGCVIVKAGRIVGRGWNRVLADQDPTAHAEIVAIRDACRQLGSFQLSDCDLYASCEPCPMCMAAIYWARPRCVYYASSRDAAAAIGFDDAFIYNELQKPLEERKYTLVRIAEPEAEALFRDWKEKPDKQVY